MKLNKVEILPSAKSDLEYIRIWYLTQFGASTAKKVVKAILDAIENLELFPNLGTVTPDKWLNDFGFKILICDRHDIIYRKNDDIIYIYHIADTRTDYTKLFK